MVEELLKSVNFGKGGGLVPAIVQDINTLQVLMLGYMSKEALETTVSIGKVTFFSRSKNRLWTKGETSGNFLMMHSIKVDCDGDTLLVMAEPIGPACHNGTNTCFGEMDTTALGFLSHLEKVIAERKDSPADSSYTASLFAKGINKIAQKVGEEAVEIVIEAKDNNDSLFLNEGADLLFHFMVLLQAKGHKLESVIEILKQRHKPSPSK